MDHFSQKLHGNKTKTEQNKPNCFHQHILSSHEDSYLSMKKGFDNTERNYNNNQTNLGSLNFLCCLQGHVWIILEGLIKTTQIDLGI